MKDKSGFTLGQCVLFEELVDTIYKVDTNQPVYLKNHYKAMRDRQIRTIRTGLHELETTLREEQLCLE